MDRLNTLGVLRKNDGGDTVKHQDLLSLLVSSIFKDMRNFVFRRITVSFGFAVLLFLAAAPVRSQLAEPTPKLKAPAAIFRDSDGNLVSNNEFVDIRMANFHYPDATLVKTLDDGTTEFRLQKIPQEGMTAPAVSVKTVEGKTLNFAVLKGKVVVLHFWFIGCPVCLAQKPNLNDLVEKFAGSENVVFIAMTAETSVDVKKYAAKVRSDYIQVADAKPALEMFNFAGYPKNIVIGKNGEIVYWRSTIKAWDKFESVIRREISN